MIVAAAPVVTSVEPFVGALLGFSVGILVTAGAAIHLVRRRDRKLQDARRQARDAERMAEMGAMATGLAHEIKNPLSTIGLNAQLLVEMIDDLHVDPDERVSVQRRIRTLTGEADRLKDILSDFLEYAGEIKLDARPTDLNTVVEELADFYMPQAEHQGVRLRVELARGPLMADLDPKLVKQSLLNLVLNAAQAMSATGTPESRELILRTDRRDDTVGVHVIDTGPGIDDDTLASIFTPYFTTKAGGSGLGLPTAKRIVELHGATLEVHTEPGRGTDFTIRFPVV